MQNKCLNLFINTKIEHKYNIIEYSIMLPDSTKTTKKMYGWFSPSAVKNQDRTVTYKKKDGSNIIVSSVTDNPHDSGTTFKDIVFLGELERFVSSVPNNLQKYIHR